MKFFKLVGFLFKKAKKLKKAGKENKKPAKHYSLIDHNIIIVDNRYYDDINDLYKEITIEQIKHASLIMTYDGRILKNYFNGMVDL